ncbi:uncharacterized protein LOC135931836 [Gordionus sp. m RMFG-2023]|uniref:uncharacterized protein LOC135931836 n=1 Tax=Gordionus sp. m RMFG-2023 TaxID=3053472 RepID=UPI0031FC0022
MLANEKKNEERDQRLFKMENTFDDLLCAICNMDVHCSHSSHNGLGHNKSKQTKRIDDERSCKMFANHVHEESVEENDYRMREQNVVSKIQRDGDIFPLRWSSPMIAGRFGKIPSKTLNYDHKNLNKFPMSINEKQLYKLVVKTFANFKPNSKIRYPLRIDVTIGQDMLPVRVIKRLHSVKNQNTLESMIKDPRKPDIDIPSIRAQTLAKFSGEQRFVDYEGSCIKHSSPSNIKECANEIPSATLNNLKNQINHSENNDPLGFEGNLKIRSYRQENTTRTVILNNLKKNKKVKRLIVSFEKQDSPLWLNNLHKSDSSPTINETPIINNKSAHAHYLSRSLPRKEAHWLSRNKKNAKCSYRDKNGNIATQGVSAAATLDDSSVFEGNISEYANSSKNGDEKIYSPSPAPIKTEPKNVSLKYCLLEKCHHSPILFLL